MKPLALNGCGPLLNLFKTHNCDFKSIRTPLVAGRKSVHKVKWEKIKSCLLFFFSLHPCTQMLMVRFYLFSIKNYLQACDALFLSDWQQTVNSQENTVVFVPQTKPNGSSRLCLSHVLAFTQHVFKCEMIEHCAWRLNSSLKQ